MFIPDMYLNGEILTTVGKTKYFCVYIDCDAHDSDRATFELADLRFAMMMLSFAFINPI